MNSKLLKIFLLTFSFLTVVGLNAEGLKVGDQAPDWTLPGTDGKNHKLSEILEHGPVVLAWFPRAFTKGCTVECKNIAENGHLIRQYKVSYFMISADAIEDNKGFGEENGADFVLLSDTSTEVAKAYGVWNDYGFPNRHNIYIGTDGKILAIQTQVNVRTAAEDIASQLGELEIPKVTAG